MSSAPTSSVAPPASPEAFAQSSSANHGVSDHLSSSGLSEPLQLGAKNEHFVESSRSKDGQKRERLGKKGGGGSLSPFAQEFVPGADGSGAGLYKAVDFGSHGSRPGGRNRGPTNGNLWRPKGPQHGVSVENADNNTSGHNVTGTVRTSSGGGFSGAFRRGGNGQADRRTSRVHGDQSSSTRNPKGQSSASNSRTSSGGIVPSGGGRKAQGFNANHLLNFQYDIIQRPQPRPQQSTRKPRKLQPYNKELFLQANFRFLVSDFGDYMLNTADPDKMLDWEDVAAVNFAAPVPVQCPICLETPLCPQITTCGHIFCFPCILRYMLMEVSQLRTDMWKKCPLCFAMVSCKELRTVSIDDVHQHCVGNKVKFTLLVRAKRSIIPFQRTEAAGGSLAYSKDGQCHLFSKFTLTADAEPSMNKAISELSSWAERAQSEGGEDLERLPFVFVAMDQLRQRKDAWAGHRATEFLSHSPPVRQRVMAQAALGNGKVSGIPSSLASQKSKGVDGDDDVESSNTLVKAGPNLSNGGSETTDIVAATDAAMAELKDKSGWVYESAFSDDEGENRTVKRTNGKFGRSSRKAVEGPGAPLALDTESSDAWEESDANLDREDSTVWFGEESDQQESEKDEAQLVSPKEVELEPLSEECQLEVSADVRKPGEPARKGHHEDVEEPEEQVKKDQQDARQGTEKHDQQPKRDQEETDTYTFYQSADGQIVILHPLNVKCLVHHYGSYELLPTSLEAEIVEMEAVTQTEATRKRYRYLSHFPLTAIFQLCEVDLSNILPQSALLPFAEELRSRENRRRRIQKQDQEQRALEERIAATRISQLSPPTDADFAAALTASQIVERSLGGDFEDPFGNSPAAATSPSELDDRRLFSRVARLGFASAHDAPELTSERNPADSSAGSSPMSTDAGPSRGPISFADIILASATKGEQGEGSSLGNKNGAKKGKKPTKVIMSTAGGRRY